MKKTLLSLSMILIAILTITSCTDWPPSIFDPEDEGLPVPEITGVSATILLAGIDQVTITGSGFGTDHTKLLVYFKKGSNVGRGRTLSATDTEILVEVPNMTGDSLEIWIDLRGCFSYAKLLDPLVTINPGVKIIPITEATSPVSIAVDPVTNEMMVALGSSLNMVHVSADDSITLKVGANFTAGMPVLAMKTKGGNTYYTVREYFVVYDGSSYTRYKINDDRLNMTDLVFADNNKIYYPSNRKIYSSDHDGSNPAIPLEDTDYEFRKCALFNGDLYVSAIYRGTDSLLTNQRSIRKYPVNTDGSLGVGSMLINWTQDFAGSVINGLAFDANGKLYVATATNTPIYVIEPVGSGYEDGNMSLLYPVLLKQSITSMSWDGGEYMGYISLGGDGTVNVFRIKMLADPAPNYMP